MNNALGGHFTYIVDEQKARAAGDTAEYSRAVSVEASLQTQISNLLSNTDGVALNSLAEIVADYGSVGVTSGTRFSAIEAAATAAATAATAAAARITALEALVAALTADPYVD